MLQTAIDEIIANFTGLKYLGVAKPYKGKNYIESKPILWEDNKGNYFYIVNKQINFKKSTVKCGVSPIYEFDLYIYTQCLNDDNIAYYLIENMPKSISFGTILLPEVSKGTAIIVRCIHEDKTGCNDSTLCLDCC